MGDTIDSLFDAIEELNGSPMNRNNKGLAIASGYALLQSENARLKEQLKSYKDCEPFDIDLAQIDLYVDEFEKTGRWKNHARVHQILKLAKFGIGASEQLEKAREALETAIYDLERIRDADWTIEQARLGARSGARVARQALKALEGGGE